MGPGPEDSVFTVEFGLNGQRFLGLNGGPAHYGFSESVSIMVECADQAEVDYYWDRLTEEGHPDACGWLADKYGFRWQIVPTPVLRDDARSRPGEGPARDRGHAEDVEIRHRRTRARLRGRVRPSG
jgi:predicted 3-demethylubiquinone-9 3-methyltransferase (glyoxalase superfamily)